MTISEADFRKAIIDSAQAARDADREAILYSVNTLIQQVEHASGDPAYLAGMRAVFSHLSKVTK